MLHFGSPFTGLPWEEDNNNKIALSGIKLKTVGNRELDWSFVTCQPTYKRCNYNGRIHKQPFFAS